MVSGSFSPQVSDTTQIKKKTWLCGGNFRKAVICIVWSGVVLL